MSSLARRLGAIAVLCLGSALFVGCSQSGPKMFHVSGKVTFKGKPLPAGVVLLSPDLAKGFDGPQGFAEVKDGVFNTAERGRGVTAGPHVIKVQGFDGKPARELPLGNRLFPDYEIPIELKPETPIAIDVPTPKD